MPFRCDEIAAIELRNRRQPRRLRVTLALSLLLAGCGSDASSTSADSDTNPSDDEDDEDNVNDDDGTSEGNDDDGANDGNDDTGGNPSDDTPDDSDDATADDIDDGGDDTDGDTATDGTDDDEPSLMLPDAGVDEGSDVPLPTGELGDDSLASAAGCAGVYNPDQVLEYDFTLAPSDWASLLADDTYSVDFEAEISCNGGTSLTVGLQRKRSGGAEKVGFKVDTNLYVQGQEIEGLRKLVFENGVSSGSTVDDAGVATLVSEYFGLRLMSLSSAISSRAAIASVRVNGGPAMAYVNVENVDKRFLESRLGEDGGWLYKKSGGNGDGLKTHESDGLENPHEAYFCFWEGRGTACQAPTDDELATTLPDRLHIPQLLRFGAANAIMANTDSPLPKDNNYFYYDSVAGQRIYFPWDLDTTMRASFHVVTGTVPGGVDMYRDVLFSHWREDYTTIAREIVDQRWPLSVIDEELDRVASVAGAVLDADPYLDGTTDDAVQTLAEWWAGRLSDVSAQLASE